MGEGRAVRKPDWLPAPGLAARGAPACAAAACSSSNALDEAPRRRAHACARCSRASVRIGIEGYDNAIVVGGPGSLSALGLRAAAAAHPLLRETLPRLSFRTVASRSHASGDGSASRRAWIARGGRLARAAAARAQRSPAIACEPRIRAAAPTSQPRRGSRPRRTRVVGELPPAAPGARSLAELPRCRRRLRAAAARVAAVEATRPRQPRRRAAAARRARQPPRRRAGRARASAARRAAARALRAARASRATLDLASARAVAAPPSPSRGALDRLGEASALERRSEPIGPAGPRQGTPRRRRRALRIPVDKSVSLEGGVRVDSREEPGVKRAGCAASTPTRGRRSALLAR